MTARRAILAGCAIFAVGTSNVLAACGFCAEEVTLSEKLANCYLKTLEDERAAAAKEDSEVHLVDLSSCLLSRSATALPDLPTDGKKPVFLDEAFLIPVPALVCLARAVQDAAFEPNTALTFEVRVDCQD